MEHLVGYDPGCRVYHKHMKIYAVIRRVSHSGQWIYVNYSQDFEWAYKTKNGMFPPTAWHIEDTRLVTCG